MTEAISAVSQAMSTESKQTYEMLFGNLSAENASPTRKVDSVQNIFDKMKSANISDNPIINDMMSKDANQRDFMRMSKGIRHRMIDGMRDIFEKRTAEATGMYKTAFVTKIFSKAVQGLTQLSSAQ